jgi:hypothetical protein
MNATLFIDRKSCENLIIKHYKKSEEKALQFFWNDIIELAIKEKKVIIAHVEDGIFLILYPPMEKDIMIQSAEIAVKTSLNHLLKYGSERIMYSLSETDKYLNFIDGPYWQWLPKEKSKLLKEGEVGSTIYVSLRWLYGYLSKIATDLNATKETPIDEFLQKGIFQATYGKGKSQLNVIRLLIKMVFGGFTKEYFYKIMLSDLKMAEILDKKGKLDSITHMKLGKIPRI